MNPYRDMYLAFSLTERSREALLRVCPPEFLVVKGDHVTLQYDVTSEGLDAFINKRLIVKTFGYIVGAKSQAVLVSVNDSVHRIEEGRHYHVTISHAPNASASDSNKAIALALAQRELKLWPQPLFLNGEVKFNKRTS